MNKTIKTIAEIKALGIPPLRAQEKASDPIVYLEINLLGFPWRWFVTECVIQSEASDVLFFGYVCGFEKEWVGIGDNSLSPAR